MFAHLVFGVTALPPDTSEKLLGIGRAFAAALEENHSAGFVGTGLALAALAAIALVRSLAVEAERARRARTAHDAHRRAMISQPPPYGGRRAWPRVPARVRMSVKRKDDKAGFRYESVGTRDVGAGGVSFRSSAPPAVGSRIDFTLDLGDPKTLALHGIVVRVDPPADDPSSTIAVRFAHIGETTRERIATWVAAEQFRRIVEERQLQSTSS